MSNMRRNTCKFWKYLPAFALAWLFLQIPFARAHEDVASSEVLRAMIEADWAAQERRKNRTTAQPAAIREAYQRAK